MKPLVIYHANCTDGFGAAFAAWLKLGDEAEYLPMEYGKNFLTTYVGGTIDREIYILDFSLPQEQMDWLFQHAKRVVWLDHHKTAFEMWCGGVPSNGIFEATGTCVTGEGYTLLDDNKSGAMLAWEYFHPGTEVPRLVQHIDAAANRAVISELLDRLEAAEGGLETERMRLAACGVAALGYFEGCAEEYTSASLDDVLNLRKRLEAAEKERDALRIELNEIRYDAAHQKALAESALRVAEGWEGKCNALRAKIEAMERQVPICLAEDLRYAENLLPALGLMPEDKLYALPGAKGE